MSYEIIREYIKYGNARSGQRINKVLFLVAHDIGNGGSTARNNRNYFNNHQPKASAHTFIDDKEILEIVPLWEKAWHVQYNKPFDNQMFGDDANDAAIGVELCHGISIDFKEAYKRYVWYFSYLCKLFNLDPKKHIVGHYILDPQRRTDPLNAFKPNGITWDGFINDVVSELNGVEIKAEAPKAEVKSIVVEAPKLKGNIATFQEWLNNNYKTDLVVDNLYGIKTKTAAIKALQTELNNQYKARLVVDGIWGPKTKSAIRTVSRGAKGNLTRIIQGMLYCLGYDPKGFDGIFGDNSYFAVRKFQGDQKLIADGLVGENTLTKMFQ